MKREFVVVDREDEYGQVVLSLAAMEVGGDRQICGGAMLRAMAPHSAPASLLQVSVFWQRIRQLQEDDVTVFVKVESANRGGLLVKYGPYEGFVPVSQFSSVSGQLLWGCRH
jgi:small subunit ribosomal protein S1